MRKREMRERIAALEARDADATDVIVRELQATASRTSAAALARELAVIEACAGLLARALATATIATDSPAARRVVTPQLLGQIGRSLIRWGEYVALVDLPNIRQASSVTVTSTTSGEWRYEMTLAEPSESRTITRAAADVLHVRWAVDPQRPWRGLSPAESAGLDSQLAAELVAALRDESAGPRGHLLPVPDPDAAAPVGTAIRGLKGQIALVPTFESWSGDQPRGLAEGWRPRRIGPEPPAELAEIYRAVSDALTSACGVPPELLAHSTTRRESHLRYLRETVMPIAADLSETLSVTLGVTVMLSFPDLTADTLRSQAAVAQSLATAGVSTDRALMLAGLAA